MYMLKKRILGGGMACAMAVNCLLAVPFGTVAAATKFEFEDGTQTGSAEVLSEQSGYSGKGYVFLKDNTDTVSVTVTAPETGMYDLSIGYAAVYGDKVQGLEINGVSQGNVSYPEGTTFEEVKFGTVKLNKGDNEVTIVGSWGWTLFDYVSIEAAEIGELECSNKLSDPKATKEAQGLMNYMATVYGDYIISGQQETYGGGHNGNYEWEFDYLEDLTGKVPAVRGFDFMNYNPLYGWNDGTTERVIEWANERGGIATASWHINVPKDFASYTLGEKLDWSKCTYGTATDFSPAKVISDKDSKEYKYFMECVDMLAAELKKTQDAGVPILFRPFHEAEGAGGETGSWFWWGKDGSGTYKALWKLLYTTLTEEYGLHNLIWEFNSYTYGKSANWYPGDDCVDIVGYDKYNASANNPNESAISSTFFNLVDMYGGAGKIVALTECDTIPSIDAMLEEGAYWSYFCPWYEGDEDGGKFLTLFNNEATLKKVYQHENVITLDELPDYKEYEYTGEEFIPTTTEPTEPTQPTAAPEEGHAKLVEEEGYTAIIFPEAVGSKVYLEVELPSGVSQANGGLGGSVEIDGEYYWVNIQWSASESGKVLVDMTNPLNVTLGTTEITDKDIIKQAIAKIQEQTSFQGQVWWAGTADGNDADTAGVKITDAYLAAGSGTTDPTEPSTPPVVVEGGFYVDGQTIRDANGNEFIMRGVNIAHCWYKNYTKTSIEAAASLGTNCVRIVCSNGVQWDKTTASELENIIEWCKANKQICVLEVHDATGKDEASAIVAAAEYWTEFKDLLNENKAFVILNIANEWYGQWNSSAWADGCKQAIGVVRDAGIENMIMIDSAGWGQYPTSIKEEGKSVFNADPNKNTVFSIHMYEYAGGNADTIKSNIEGAMQSGAPIVIGEFGNKHTDGDVDEAYLMDYCVDNEIGYIGWSWKGNSGGVEYLDLVSDWEGKTLTEWGEIFFNGANGVKESSELCSVYTASTNPTNPTTPSTGDVAYGDVNCDGTVNLLDVLALNRNLLIGEALTDQGVKNADVDRDNKPTSVDALNILKYTIKLVTSLPV